MVLRLFSTKIINSIKKKVSTQLEFRDLCDLARLQCAGSTLGSPD